MAVQAERVVKDGLLIEKTRVILDSLTPQLLESEFPRALKRIQERRELIRVLGELDPKLIAELRQEDVDRSVARYYIGDISREVMLETLVHKARFEDFSSRVTVKVTPAIVDGTAVTIAT